MKRLLICLFVGLRCLSAFGATANQTLVSAETAGYAGLSDKELRIVSAYLLQIAAAVTGTPTVVLQRAATAGYTSGLDDKSLSVISAYLLSQNPAVQINVSPDTNSSTYGIQEALNTVPAGGPQWGTNVTGATIRLGAGDYYLTNAILYSNTFPYNIKLQGAGILNTRIIYAGLGTTTNMLTFKGGGNPSGGLNLPANIEVCDLTLTSITNMQGALLVITNNSYSYIHNVNFTDWEVLTNNLHGPSLSIDGPAPTQPPGNIGMIIGSTLDHGDRVEYCYFAGLACCIDYWGDHIYLEDMKTAFIGQFGGGPTDGTAWANTSPYTEGPALLFRAGLSVNLENVHFYQVFTCVMCDSGGAAATAAITMRGCQWESADQGFVLSSDGQSVTLDQLAPSGPGSGDFVRKKITSRSPYTLGATTFVPRYGLYSLIGTGIDGNNNPATNFGVFSVQTNLMSQPIANSHTPNFNKGYEVARTNTGPVVFQPGIASTIAGDFIHYQFAVHNTGGSLQPLIFPPPYITNNSPGLSGAYNVTNICYGEIRGTVGVATNVTIIQGK